MFCLRPRFACIGRTGILFGLLAWSKDLMERTNNVRMIANMLSRKKLTGKGIDTISQSRQKLLCSRNIHSAFLPYFLQKDLFLKAAPFGGFVRPNLLQFFQSPAACFYDSLHDLQEVGQFFQGFAFLILCQLFVQLLSKRDI
ncbi:hypothetical protein BACCAP_04512 [Pseudoflavonifractor capillosus ATCC 29799]|uniref:Uncharacterized protein n=1 Tax=Pseudoflavonifractor capillosus ATCC 29799 TaxID=411467 RepID=A6P1Y4_9FIRM|nr:hypothetical protein BACCAP_04512 [Pseudoflavonifractor capillosus ATCC 29799]